ncbi:MAG: hypothetical protein AAGE98_13510 [Actinomycetota bacterium]
MAGLEPVADRLGVVEGLGADRMRARRAAVDDADAGCTSAFGFGASTAGFGVADSGRGSAWTTRTEPEGSGRATAAIGRTVALCGTGAGSATARTGRGAAVWAAAGWATRSGAASVGAYSSNASYSSSGPSPR